MAEIITVAIPGPQGPPGPEGPMGPPGSGGGGVTDHGALTGLSDDDHPQYHNDTRGDARYSAIVHTHLAADISNSTATGRSVLTAVDAAAARTAIGAGTSNLALGITSSTAKAGDYQPASTNISDSTAVGRSVLTAVDAAAARTAIGAGTSNLALGTTGTTAAAGNHTHVATDISNSTATGRSVLTATDAAAARTAIGAGTSSLVIGTTSTTAKAGDYQPTAANISDSTSVGRSVLTAASATAARTAIGAGQVDSSDSTVLNVIKITQAAYDALGTKVATTLYVIVG